MQIYETYTHLMTPAEFKEYVTRISEIELNIVGYLSVYQNKAWPTIVTSETFRTEPVFNYYDDQYYNIISETNFMISKYSGVKVLKINLTDNIDKFYYIIARFVGMGTRLSGNKLTILRPVKTGG